MGVFIYSFVMPEAPTKEVVSIFLRLCVAVVVAAELFFQKSFARCAVSIFLFRHAIKSCLQ